MEKHDQMDLLMDATDPDKSLVPQLGVLAVDITDQLRSAIRHDPHCRAESSWWAAPPTLLCRTAGCRLGTSFTRSTTSRLILWKRCVEWCATLKPGAAVVLQIERDGGLQYLAFEME